MSKYHNIPTVVDGKLFDSKKEAARYRELRLLEKSGEIRGLENQVRFDLNVNGHHIAQYIADFCYDEKRVDGDWEYIVEDVKGVRTAVYRLKRKLMYAINEIEVRET